LSSDIFKHPPYHSAAKGGEGATIVETAGSFPPMKLSKFIFTFLILFAAIQFCFGQGKPRAVLLDRFVNGTCDNIESVILDFLLKIHNEPGSTGYAVLYSEENLSRTSIGHFNEVWGSVLYYKFAADRLRTVRAKKEGQSSIEFWKVPAGAETPPLAGEAWTDELPHLAKAFQFGSVFSEACYTFTPEPFAGFLLANPQLRGNIAVYDKSPNAAKKEGDRWLKTLTEEHKIPRDRLKVFYGKAKRFDDGSGYYPDVEFWLVPVKKKK
jgi:hypothetical protein